MSTKALTREECGIKRSSAEVAARVIEARKRDALGFEWHEYLIWVDFEDLAKVAEGSTTTEVEWDEVTSERGPIVEVMREYMAFAWEKANDCRGISAARSMMHYRAWLWLSGEDGFEDLTEYDNYGKDHLVRVCEHLGLDVAEFDDGVRTNGGGSEHE